MKKFVIIGGTWRDSSGNTYHRVKIIDPDNARAYTTGRAYGYGNAYRVTAEHYIEGTLKVSAYKMIDGGSYKISSKQLNGEEYF